MRTFDAAASIRRLLLLVLFFSAAVCAQSLTYADTTAQPAGGPLNLLISYRSEPANRPAFRVYLQQNGTRGWKSSNTTACSRVTWSCSTQ